MKKTLMLSAIAVALLGAPAFAQEEEDYTETETAQPVDEAFDEIDESLPYESEASSEPAEIVAKSPEEIQAELTAMMNLPVLDASGERIGVTSNAVMKDGQAHLLIVKLDNVYLGDKLRAVESKEAATVNDGTAVGLATLTKAAVREQAPFEYKADMVTLLPSPEAEKTTETDVPSY